MGVHIIIDDPAGNSYMQVRNGIMYSSLLLHFCSLAARMCMRQRMTLRCL